MLRRLLCEEEGQTVIEYGFLISLIAFVVLVAIAYFGRRVQNTYTVANNQMTN